MDAATLEETNKLRISLGMKPLPVPGAAASGSEDEGSGHDEPADYLEARTAEAYDNFQKLRDEEEAKRKRDERAAAIKKAREKAQRHAVMEGKGLGELGAGEEELDAKAWLMGQKKRQKKIAKLRRLEEEQAAAEAQAAAAVQYTSRDLAGVKVAHDVSQFVDGDEQILTLKDATIDQYEEEGDELENLGLREQEKLKKNLDLKKKKADYNPLDMDNMDVQNVLSKYDEEIYGEKRKRFTLDTSGAVSDLADILDTAPSKSSRGQTVNIDIIDENARPSSDYLDISEIKVKKPKKKKTKSTRQKPVDADDFLLPEPTPEDDQKMDIDTSVKENARKRKSEDVNFVDDDDLQLALSMQRRNALKKRKKMRPEDIVKELKEADDSEEAVPEDDGGLVIGEVSEFVAGIKKPDEEDEKPRRHRQSAEPSASAPKAVSPSPDDNEDVPMNGYLPTQDEHDLREQASKENDEKLSGDEDIMEEKTISGGLGATLSLLRERGILKESDGAERHETFLKKQEFLAKKRRMELEIEEAAKHQRERDRQSGRLERMGQREQQEFARQQNTQRDLQASRKMAELFNAEFKPTFEIKYTDDMGRRLDQKDAFKHLSHQFHGKGSGKGKTDKKLKKIADEQRREAQSVLDASQNVGMSSVTAQQLKKRREAGVRLA
ncbi:Uncharacterized protein SAPIO_CDS2835 [Scedosporium apiospermum]|uniref:SART-1 family protein n=1 Tax=Pseudallescheria apiosperma TaxID=563466 RepID=A0A084GBM8_PSEDA|nr:Uncharacterized protein SAPIO_CDS2835 [Scedosporium apiospermum]KEZ44740.1 Uncharacterized protein SAPIO_CDS2835 [Scedosporium apiospermum]